MGQIKECFGLKVYILKCNVWVHIASGWRSFCLICLYWQMVLSNKRWVWIWVSTRHNCTFKIYWSVCWSQRRYSPTSCLCHHRRVMVVIGCLSIIIPVLFWVFKFYRIKDCKDTHQTAKVKVNVDILIPFISHSKWLINIVNRHDFRKHILQKTVREIQPAAK